MNDMAPSPVINTSNWFNYHCKVCAGNRLRSLICFSEPSTNLQRWQVCAALPVTGGGGLFGTGWGGWGWVFFKMISSFMSLFCMIMVIRSFLPFMFVEFFVSFS